MFDKKSEYGARKLVQQSYYWVAFALVACCAVVPFWLTRYLPLSDLPQHVAQLSIRQHWRDPALHYWDYYRVNWYTNQLFAYELTRAFALVMPLMPAVKCVLSLAVVGTGLVTHQLVRVAGSNRYFSLLSFPIAFGFNMYWGLFNYVVAIPLGLLLIAVSAQYALTPSRWRALGVFGATYLLFAAHVLILAYTGLISALLIFTRARGWQAKLLGCSALASVLPTVALWWSAIRTYEPSTAATAVATHWGWHRAWEFFSYQMSAGNALSEGIFGLSAFGLPLALGARPAREPWRWIPFAITVLLFLVVPVAALDIDLLYCRVATFALPTFLFALDMSPEGAVQRARALLTGLVAARLAFVSVQFERFGAEASSLHEVLSATQPGKRLLYLPSSVLSKVVPHDVYSHFGCYYQIERGGVVDYSFAELFPTWYRYLPEVEPTLPAEFDSHTHQFRYGQHDGPRFDYFLVHGPVLPAWFEGAPMRPPLVARAQEWTLLRAEVTRTESAAR